MPRNCGPVDPVENQRCIAREKGEDRAVGGAESVSKEGVVDSMDGRQVCPEGSEGGRIINSKYKSRGGNRMRRYRTMGLR